MSSRATRPQRILTLVATLLLATATIGVAAETGFAGFGDVAADDMFADDIAWLAENGITFGCGTQDGTLMFCPDENLTRGQAAAFLRRLAESGVIDAATIAGMDLAELEALFASAGEAGPPGADGARGADGADGARGADGADGKDGKRGATGADGPKGADGIAGSRGPAGERGKTGPGSIARSAIVPLADGTMISPPAGQYGTEIDGSGPVVLLSADGTHMAAGARYNGGMTGAFSGQTRIYRWNGISWVQVGAAIDGETAYDHSGWSVSLSADGTRVAIGTPYNDGNGNSSGHTRIYEHNGTAWVQLGADIDGEAADDLSGWSVSLSADGTRVAIGAYGNDGVNGSNSGHTRIYDWDGTAWVQTGADIDGETAGGQSGNSVSLSADGTRVAIGAPLNDGNGTDSGHTRIYDWDGTAWVQTGADIDGEAANDQSGWSVSLSADGTRVAIGAYGNDGLNGSNSGHTRIYEHNGTAWVQTGADIDGETADDRSGWSVSLSGDGTRVAIGAIYNDGNGTDSGHTRIYDWDATDWVQTGGDIDGEAGDSAGQSVSLSADGSRIAIGAYGNHARTYEYDGMDWTQAARTTTVALSIPVPSDWDGDVTTLGLHATMTAGSAGDASIAFELVGVAAGESVPSRVTQPYATVTLGTPGTVTAFSPAIPGDAPVAASDRRLVILIQRDADTVVGDIRLWSLELTYKAAVS